MLQRTLHEYRILGSKAFGNETDQDSVKSKTSQDAQESDEADNHQKLTEFRRR